MSRYFDVDKLIKKIFPYDVVDKNAYAINAQAVYNAIQNVPAADVVPKGEFDQLKHKYELAVAEREANVKGFTEQLSKVKTEVAKEIFSDLENFFDSDGLSVYLTRSEFYELEDKYTEGGE